MTEVDFEAVKSFPRNAGSEYGGEDIGLTRLTLAR